MGCTRSPFSGGFRCYAFCTGPVNPGRYPATGGFVRFSIANLLLLVASWPVAYFLSPQLKLQQTRTTYGSTVTSNTLSTVRQIGHMLHKDGELTHANLVNSLYLANPWSQIDSWGNPLQYVRDESGHLVVEDGTVLPYSCGQDGKSESEGNDPDDINCWNVHHRPFYRRQMQNYRQRKRIWRTVWVTPLVFVTFLLAKQMLAAGASKVAG